MKKFLSLLLTLIMVFSSLSLVQAEEVDETDLFDTQAIYRACCALYPEYINNIKSFDITDDQLLYFMETVVTGLDPYKDIISVENFEEYIFEAIEYAFNRRKNIPLRDALLQAYPEAINDVMDGKLPEEFAPIYDTAKHVIFDLEAPAITISTSTDESGTVFYAHSLNLPENCMLTLAAYDKNGTMLQSKSITPNVESDGLFCTSEDLAHARLFAWYENTLIPICDSYELIMEH